MMMIPGAAGIRLLPLQRLFPLLRLLPARLARCPLALSVMRIRFGVGWLIRGAWVNALGIVAIKIQRLLYITLLRLLRALLLRLRVPLRLRLRLNLLCLS